jgi:hypothetical protein
MALLLLILGLIGVAHEVSCTITIVRLLSAPYFLLASLIREDRLRESGWGGREGTTSVCSEVIISIAEAEIQVEAVLGIVRVHRG